VPEGDSIHRVAQKLGPILIGHPVRALELQRRVESAEAITGKTVEGVEARGKNLLVHFEDGWSLHVHLKMWGRIFFFPLGEPDQKKKSGADTVVVLDTDTHRVVVVRAPIARLIRTRDMVRDLHFRHLGPDLLGPSFEKDEALRRLTAQKQVPLGEALMDQSLVAGIGNVWKSELCFNLKLDPFAPVLAFTEAELEALLVLARRQMTENVERKPRMIPDPFAPRLNARATRLDRRQGQEHVSVYGRPGEPCYDCGTHIQMQRQGSLDRSTYYCPHCQPARSAA
jgi:endonuclease-8